MYVYDEFRKEVISLIEKAAKQKISEANLVRPPAGMGEMGTSIAFVLAKKLKKKPNEIAADVAKKIKIPDGSLVGRIQATGPYVNFFVSEKYSEKVIGEIARNKRYGSGEKRKERVLVEHTSVNPSGPVHVGRFRNPIIGDSLARIYRFMGYDVHVQNYINNVGKQVAIIAWAKDRGIKPEKNLVDRYKKYKDKGDFQTFFIYVPANMEMKKSDEAEKEVNELLKKCESGDIKSLDKMDKAAQFCLKGQQEILEKCGFRYDEFVFESKFIENKEVERMTQKLKGLAASKQLANGAYSLDLSDYGIKKEEGTVFQRADGTSVYLTRDICFHLDKLRRFDRSINVLGEDHKVEGEEVLAILDLLKEQTDKHKILFFSFVNLADKKMSTRAGETVPLDAIIDEGIEKAHKEVQKKNPDIPAKEQEEIAQAVGIGAIKYYILKTEPLKNILFEWDKALDFNGDTGPYLQYTYVRTNSILKKAKTEPGADVKYLKEKEEKDLISLLARFPDIVKQAGENLKPYLVANYAHELAERFNTFYHAHQVIQDDNDLEQARLALVGAVNIVLSNAMQLIGLETPERM